MGFLRDAVYAVAIVTTSPVWVYRLLATGKWRTDWPGRFGRCGEQPPQDRPTILIHAVSVGEVNAIKKLVAVLADRGPVTPRLVISTTTDTGYGRAKELFEPAHRVVRFPFDLSFCVNRFLDAVRPDLVALTELEVWPNFVDQCSRRNIPVCVINGRLSRRSFRWYRRIGPLVRPAFSSLAAVATQTPQYAQRFVALGVRQDRVQVLDSMKWDTAGDLLAGQSPRTVQPSATDPQGEPPTTDAEKLALAMGIDRKRPVIVAGSTGPGEERMLMEQCPENTQLVLAPRKPERFEQVAALDRRIIRRSQHHDTAAAPTAGSKYFLLDTIGELTKAYALADVAVVGRSFLGQHGSNPMEPVALEKPTIIGPHYDDFADIVEALRQSDGIVVTDHPGQAADALLADPQRSRALAQRGLHVILSRQGATERHVDLLQGLLGGERVRGGPTAGWAPAPPPTTEQPTKNR